MFITSLQNKKIVEYGKLKQKKHRDRQEMFIVEEEHLIEEAKKRAIVVETIALIDSGLSADIYVTEPIMRKLSVNQSLNSIIAICKYFNNHVESSKVIILDQVQDPGNVGTIIRTAYALGYEKIILANKSVDKYNDKMIRATQGAIFHVDLINTDEIAETIANLKESGYQVLGTALSNQSKELEEFSSYDKLALVFGNEGQGLSKEALALIDQEVKIPMTNFESLNVAVAAGIVMYYFR